MDLCQKHRSQMRQQGKILDRTIHTPNDFIVHGDITEIIMYDIDKKESGRSLINTIHLDMVKQYKWSVDSKGYAANSNSKGLVLLHRIITGAKTGMVVDHIDHNRLNNIDSNLRICTNQQNIFNQKISIANTSGYKGVVWHKLAKKWMAGIFINKRNIYLGIFSDINDAIKARKEAEIKYFGEFRYIED